MKRLLKKFLWVEMSLVAVLVLMNSSSVLAQAAAPASAVVTKPTTGPSQKMLDHALTPETRQTLQEAMDSVDTTTPPAPTSDKQAMVGPGEALVMDGTKVTRIPYASLPDPVKKALSTDFPH